MTSDNTVITTAVESYFGSDFQKTEKCIFKEKEFLQYKIPLKCIFNDVNGDLRNIYSDRSATMMFNDTILFKIKLHFHIVYNLISSSNIINQDDENYFLRINWLYLGKSVLKCKYSSSFNVCCTKKPKSALLIIILLFMCGDTGASLNPGPVCMNDAIDPDLNHFIPDFEFQTHSVETFAENVNNVKDSFNIIHNNARSLMADGRIDEYIMLLKNL